LPSADAHLHVTILAGGEGTRFWPASRPSRPKQLLALASDRALVVDTVERARKFAPPERIRILAGAHLKSAFREVLPDFPDEGYWLEPLARGTAPVLAWAAHRVLREDPDAVLISLHADHLIRPDEALAELLPRAAELARREEILLTVAVPPDRPETGYGWIRPGALLCDEPGLRAWRVGAFAEKPDAATARAYLEAGYLWNSGIFVWPARTFLEEVREHGAEISPHLERLDLGDEEGFFEACPRISVDSAILERSSRVGAVEATFAWDDVGSWSSLPRSYPADPSGNVGLGECHLVESRDNLVWAEDGPVVLFGVEGLVVVRSGGVTVVASRDLIPRWRELMDALPPELREGTP
jgi:mannose-1-phosphate guanylyltransferase